MRIGKTLASCPVCSGRVSISEVKCNECGASLTSKFELCPVCLLPNESYDFLIAFIKNGGSIKDTEKELSISYPTVKSRLAELQRLMGFQAKASTESAADILAMLERGEITAEEAEALLKTR